MTYLTTLLLSFQILLYCCIDVLKQGWLSFYLTQCNTLCTQYLHVKAKVAMHTHSNESIFPIILCVE